jgi:U2 small nuclear ribonucleoprotein B''
VKIEDLKEALTSVFKPYGPIVDIIMKKSVKRKGQAFVVFNSAENAQKALFMDGFKLYDKKIKVSMARNRSDATLQNKGTEEQLEQHKRERLTMKGTSLVQG